MLLIFALTLGFFGPAVRADSGPNQTIHKSKGKADYAVSNNDEAMRQATESARKTVNQFITAVKNPRPGQTDFEVLKPCVEGVEVEHIWLSDVKVVGNRFQGTVDNAPRKATRLHEGQVCSVNPDEITDWLFIENGKLVGGYTVRAHYKLLSPADKAEFKQHADFKIED
ncbi:MAG: DUF2314 domain-containing protein [Verrucomicrobia bacterium]|nr:DUF2314 domain-containing protein [Verrucomicrobiota bacterium]